MSSCHEMKKGEVYVCEECGLELQVVKECTESGAPADECGCETDAGPCAMACCGTGLVKKQS